MVEKIIGIYTITCIPVSMVYVGSSIHIERRWSQHRKVLDKGRHPNKKLQQAWKKYGASSFCFSIIKKCDVDVLRQIEQKYIVRYNSVTNGFNRTYKTEWNKPVVVRTLKFNRKGEILNRCLSCKEKKKVKVIGYHKFVDALIKSGVMIKKIVVAT